MKIQLSATLFAILMLLPGMQISAQSWDFIKEKDGIRVFTRNEPGSSLKSFKGTASLQTTTDKLYELIGNGNNVSWWDKNVQEIKLLAYEKDRFIRYFLVYDVPWPFSDRELCVEAKITDDPVNGGRTVLAQPLLNVIPENPDRIRIKKYWQKWTIIPRDKGIVNVTLEGFVDPGGSVPAWLYNMVITETPLKVIRAIRDRVE